MGLCECGGNCPKYLKREWNRKQGRENKDFKKGGGGGKLSQEVGALKRRGGAGTPLRTMGYYIVSIAKTNSSIIGTFIRYEVSFFCGLLFVSINL